MHLTYFSMSLDNLFQRTTAAKVPMSNTLSLTMSPKESRAAASLRGDTLHSAPDCHLCTEGHNLVGNAREREPRTRSYRSRVSDHLRELYRILLPQSPSRTRPRLSGR